MSQKLTESHSDGKGQAAFTEMPEKVTREEIKEHDQENVQAAPTPPARTKAPRFNFAAERKQSTNGADRQLLIPTENTVPRGHETELASSASMPTLLKPQGKSITVNYCTKQWKYADRFYADRFFVESANLRKSGYQALLGAAQTSLSRQKDAEDSDSDSLELKIAQSINRKSSSKEM